jgi:SOS-response transcriptional repressor LexA
MMNPKTTPKDVIAAAQSPPMSDHLVRLSNLESFRVANGLTQADLGRRLGKPPSQVSAWYKRTRNIGEKLARQIEDKLKMGPYSLDERPSIPRPGVIGGNPPSLSAASLPPVTMRSKEVPVLLWPDIPKMLNTENAALKQKAVHLDTFAVCSTRAKFLCMPDDSMAPEITAGDHVLLDPTEAPRAGDIVLVGLPGGEHFIRLFRPRTALVFEATPLNPAYQPVNSQDDAAVVVAVMVEHRRYRRGG